MWWLFTYICIYVTGGFTFLPLALLGLYVYGEKIFGTMGASYGDNEKNRAIQVEADREEVLAKTKESMASSNRIAGWMEVRRTFDPKTATEAFADSTVDLPGAEIMANGNGHGHGGTGSGSMTPVQSSAVKFYRAVAAYGAKKGDGSRDLYYGVQKGDVLFLYTGEDQKDVQAALDVTQWVVRIEKKSEVFTGKDAEMFGKKSCIVLHPAPKDKQGLPIVAKGMESDGKAESNEHLETRPIYIYIKSSLKKEDWYLNLLQSSAERPHHTGVWSPSGMRALIDTIETEPDPLSVRWLNVLIGRVFFGLHKTAWLENLIIERITKKIAKVDVPTFLAELTVKEFNVGGTAPILSNPMLKECKPDGTICFTAHISVKPGPNVADLARVMATCRVKYQSLINIDIPIEVAGHLKYLEGDIEMMIKGPPSNRIWWGFTKPPKMEMDIQPVVSKKVLDWSFIVTGLHKYINKAMVETCILPNMDDIAFFDTSAYPIRGAIFSNMGRDKLSVSSTHPEAEDAPIDMTTSAEDPSSATVDSNLRRRAPNKAQTIDIGAVKESEEEIHQGIPRTDTAPAGLSSQIKPGAKKSGLSGTWTPSLPQSRTASSDSVSKSTISEASTSTTRNGAPSMPRIPSDGTETSSIHSSHREISPSQLHSTHPDLSTLRPSSPAPFSRPTDLSEVSPASSHTDVSSAPTTTSILNSIRAGDKKALQGQVNATRDNIKSKWTSWTNKNRTPSIKSVSEDKEVDKPGVPLKTDKADKVNKPEKPATPAPPAEEEKPELTRVTSAGRRSLDQKPMTLQERLNAAAAAAAGGGNANPATLSRARSNTASSKGSTTPATKPALLSHPSKSGAPPVESIASANSDVNKTENTETSELATPITAASLSASASVSASGSGSASGSNTNSRRASSGSMTVMQPSAGKGIVVPRVPKRPGELVGLGSHPTEGMIRRVSGQSGDIPLSSSSEPTSASSDKIEPPETTESVPPPLPPRKSLEEKRETSEKTEMPPPPLPARHPSPKPESASPASTYSSTYSNDDKGQSPPMEPESPDLDLKRSDSAPAATTVSPPSEVHSPPKASPPALPLRHPEEAEQDEQDEAAAASQIEEPRGTHDQDAEDKKGDLASAIEADAEVPPASHDENAVDDLLSKSTPLSTPAKHPVSNGASDAPVHSSPNGSSAEEALRKLAERDNAFRASQEPTATPAPTEAVSAEGPSTP